MRLAIRFLQHFTSLITVEEEVETMQEVEAITSQSQQLRTSLLISRKAFAILVQRMVSFKFKFISGAPWIILERVVL